MADRGVTALLRRLMGHLFRHISARRRLLDWMTLAALFVGAGVYFQLALELEPDKILPPKVTLLSIMLALGTFQYRLQLEIVDRQRERIDDPKWVEFRAKVEHERRTRGVEDDVLAEWDKALGERGEVEETIREFVRENIVAHNQAVITNIRLLSRKCHGSGSPAQQW